MNVVPLSSYSPEPSPPLLPYTPEPPPDAIDVARVLVGTVAKKPELFERALAAGLTPELLPHQPHNNWIRWIEDRHRQGVQTDWRILHDVTQGADRQELKDCVQLASDGLTPLIEDWVSKLRDTKKKKHLAALLDDVARKVREPLQSYDDVIAEFDCARNSIDACAGTSVKSDIQFASDACLEALAPYLVKDLINSGQYGFFYGPSGASKTFVLIKLSYCLARGEAFFGRKTKEVAVLYVPLEGQAQFSKRLIAANKIYGDTGKRLAVLDAPISLGSHPDAQQHLRRIENAAKELAKEAGVPVGAIFIDTYARVLAGGDEDKASEAAVVMNQAAQIAKRTGAAVIFAHHTGKDETRGMRGSNAIFAAADFVLKVAQDSGDVGRSITIEKNKDGADGELGSFVLDEIVVGEDAEGDVITSCVIQEAARLSKRGPKRPKRGSQSHKALEVLEGLINDGKGVRADGRGKAPAGATLVALKDWRDACRERELSDGDPDNEKKAFQRGHSALSLANWVADHGGQVWLLNGTRFSAYEERGNGL